jgi:sialate O-acetylesterase
MINIRNNSNCFVFLDDGIPRFANYYQDHMVLQRGPQRALIWGFSDSNKAMNLKIGEKIYETISRSESINDFGESTWSITLDPVYDEGPYDIIVSQPLINGTLMIITIQDVLFGDVWLCSGQSNMEMTVRDIFNATQEIANAGKYPKIRVFTSGRTPSPIPVEELIENRQNWSIASSSSIGGPGWVYFSAVCWLYGRMIHEALGGRPIGLIASSYGGTAIELWMPPDAFQKCYPQT